MTLTAAHSKRAYRARGWGRHEGMALRVPFADVCVGTGPATSTPWPCLLGWQSPHRRIRHGRALKQGLLVLL